MLKIVPSHRFKRDLKTAQKRGLDMGLLRVVVNTLAAGEKLDSKYRAGVVSLPDRYTFGFVLTLRNNPDWALLPLRSVRNGRPQFLL